VVACAISLALAFDEFGMWLHLGRSYGHQAAFDAMTVVAACAGLFIVAPSWRALRYVHLWTMVGVAVSVGVFFGLWVRSFDFIERTVVTELHSVEFSNPQWFFPARPQ
jgi:hypothetical protein